jgi:hypothetical protein
VVHEVEPQQASDDEAATRLDRPAKRRRLHSPKARRSGRQSLPIAVATARSSIEGAEGNSFRLWPFPKFHEDENGAEQGATKVMPSTICPQPLFGDTATSTCLTEIATGLSCPHRWRVPTMGVGGTGVGGNLFIVDIWLMPQRQNSATR